MSTKTYAEKLKDPRWQKKRLEIMQRDDFKCTQCNSSKKTLHVHHRFYLKGSEPWEYENDALRTLCEQCHAIRHRFEASAKDLFAKALSLLECDQVGELSEQIEKAISCGVENGVVFIDADTYSGEADIRWFSYAYNNPEARIFYEEVTECVPNWDFASKKKQEEKAGAVCAEQELSEFFAGLKGLLGEKSK